MTDQSWKVLGILLTAIFGLVNEPSQASETSFRKVVDPFIQNFCIDCHNADLSEGGVSLHGLTTVTSENVSEWKRVWEMVALKEMPPPDNEMPTLQDRLKVSDWITSQLSKALADEGSFDLHQMLWKANHLDHDLLFNDDLAELDLQPPSTPARLWRITPEEHLIRLSELVIREPPYDPKHPHARSRGDMPTTDRSGKIQLTLGIDRIIPSQPLRLINAYYFKNGITPLLAKPDVHGLKSYPNLNTVRRSEITEIAKTAKVILAFMINGPYKGKVVDKMPRLSKKERKGHDGAIYIKREPTRPLTPVYDYASGSGSDPKKLLKAVNYLFEALTFRPPTAQESQHYFNLAEHAIQDLGKEEGVLVGLMPIFLDRDALFRVELADYGTPDAHGRVMLQGQELMLAVNAALSYLPPDEQLKSALQSGRLKTREDVRREVRRMLDDEAFRKPRILQFFREYFEYDLAPYLDKDQKYLRASGGTETPFHLDTMHQFVRDLDWIVEDIVRDDKQVLKRLLTTDTMIVDPLAWDNFYFVDEETRLKERKTHGGYDRRKLRAKYKVGPRQPGNIPSVALGEDTRLVGDRNYLLHRYASDLDLLKLLKEKGKIQGPLEPIQVRIGALHYNRSLERLKTRFSTKERLGVLTHPAWLVAHSDAMDNHAIHRGKWVRERLLGGAVPDVPITVDAQLPDEPESTLRHRMRVTKENACWRCHQKMDPLGLPFEMYNQLGMHRTTEQGKPVDATGEIIDSGDPSLDGKVDNAIEMIQKLAASERVEQVFVRHVFRFWMGRNETIHDAPILRAAHKAYRDNGGSLKALLESLLTSDAFLYRKVERGRAS